MDKDNKENIEQQYCEDCVFYWKALCYCSKQENEDLKVFDDTKACEDFKKSIFSNFK